MKKSLLLITALTCSFLYFSSTAIAQGCLPGWQYQTPITVSNANASALTDFQVNLTINTQNLISQGKLNVDGSDMRFIDACCNEICFVIESGINTASTSVWVNVPTIPASGSSDIYMVYGNTGATDGQNATCTFDLYEDFDSGTQSSFTSACGSITESIAAGVNNVSWSSSGVMLSNASFSATEVFTVEADVTGASGTWPGLYWYDEPTQKSYALLIDASQARISVAGGGADWCTGHNWASALIPYSGVAGLWSHTWVGTADIRSDFPTIGAITSTDATWPLTGTKRLGYGGISSGSGTLNMNWIRVRKWAELVPTSLEGSEGALGAGYLADIPLADTLICDGDSLLLDPGAGFNSYAWSTGDSSQTIYASSTAQYFVDVVNADGCPSSDTINVTVSAPITSAFTSSLVGFDVSLTDASTGADTYAWDFGDGNSSTAMSPAHTYATTGTFTICLTVTNVDGCSDVWCEDVIVDDAGINDLFGAYFSIFPIPTSDVLTIQSTYADDLAFEIIDLSGKAQHTGVLSAGDNELDVRKLDAGVYVMRIAIEGEHYTQRLIIE